MSSKDNLPWTFRFIYGSRGRLYYSYVLNSKQTVNWIPSCLLRSELSSSFLHGNINIFSLYNYFHKYINHIFTKFWSAKFGWNGPMWSENIGWSQRRCLTYSGIHVAGTKKPQTCVQHLHPTMHSGFRPYIMIFSSPFNQNLSKRSEMQSHYKISHLSTIEGPHGK